MELIRANNPTPWEERATNAEGLTYLELTEVFATYGLRFDAAHGRTLGFVTHQGLPTNLGLLLSDQNPFHLKVGRVRNDRIEVRMLKGSLLRQVEDTSELFASVNERCMRKTEGLASVSEWAWPPRALREALVNCTVHRDYGLQFETTVDIRPDVVTVLSFGSVLDNMPVELLLREGVGKCRNPKLAAVFQRLGWMENYGTGFPDILRCYAGALVQPEIVSTLRSFSIRLPRLPDPMRDDGTSREKIRRTLALRSEWRSQEIAEETGLSRTLVNTTLHDFIAAGEVVRLGRGRATRYRRI